MFKRIALRNMDKKKKNRDETVSQNGFIRRKNSEIQKETYHR